LNNALMTAQSGLSFEEAKRDTATWGRLTESAFGAHLANAAAAGECQLSYWRERSREVDFVVQVGRRIAAIEVKSGRRREAMPGLAAFIQAEPSARPFVVGADGIPFEQALTLPVEEWISV